MPTKKKITPEDIFKKYKQKQNELQNVTQRRFLNYESYDYIFAMIQLVEKKSDIHLMLLHIENLLNNESQGLNNQYDRKNNELENYYKNHKIIIDKFLKESEGKK